MSGTVDPDCCNNKSHFRPFGNVYCPTTMCSGIPCVFKKTFKSPSRTECNCPQWVSTCQVGIFNFEEHTNSFFLMSDRGIRIFEETQKSFQVFIEVVFFQERFVSDKSVSMSIQGNRMMKTVTNVFKAKRADTFGEFILSTRNRQLCRLSVIPQNVLSKNDL